MIPNNNEIKPNSHEIGPNCNEIVLNSHEIVPNSTTTLQALCDVVERCRRRFFFLGNDTPRNFDMYLVKMTVLGQYMT